MEKQTESNIRTWGPIFLGMVFAILQGFTVYFTKNVEQSITKVEHKLEQTWDVTLVTQTKMAALETRSQRFEAEQAELEAQLQGLREDFLLHVAEHKGR